MTKEAIPGHFGKLWAVPIWVVLGQPPGELQDRNGGSAAKIFGSAIPFREFQISPWSWIRCQLPLPRIEIFLFKATRPWRRLRISKKKEEDERYLGRRATQSLPLVIRSPGYLDAYAMHRDHRGMTIVIFQEMSEA